METETLTDTEIDKVCNVEVRKIYDRLATLHDRVNVPVAKLAGEALSSAVDEVLSGGYTFNPLQAISAVWIDVGSRGNCLRLRGVNWPIGHQEGVKVAPGDSWIWETRRGKPWQEALEKHVREFRPSNPASWPCPENWADVGVVVGWLLSCAPVTWKKVCLTPFEEFGLAVFRAAVEAWRAGAGSGPLERQLLSTDDDE